MKILAFILTVIFPLFTFGQEIEILSANNDASFRGLGTYKEHVVWVSGSKGTVGKSLDAGKTWTWVNPKGYEAYDFRDIEVFSEKEALIINAGSPAIILRTTDGGKSWKEVIRDDRTEIFMDGFDFEGKIGFAFGDPIDGKFQLWKTKNKGKTWTDVSDFMFLLADEGEAGFAASGTSLKMLNTILWVGTGGKYACLYRRDEKALTIDKVDVPILQGESSMGVFSLDFIDNKTGILVGGNYLSDLDNQNSIQLTFDGGLSWEQPSTTVGGYRSCVQYINKTIALATGTSGTDMSTDGGRNWKTLSKDSYNVLSKSASGKLVYFAGGNGNIGVFKVKI